VNQVLVTVGQAVEAGQLLAQLDVTDATLALEQSDVALQINRAQLAKMANPSSDNDIAAAQAAVSRGKKSLRVSISGVAPSYQDVLSWPAETGSFITDSDNQERSRVAVIGSAVYTKLFDPTEYPIDQTIRINNLLFRVIGVMEEKGGGDFGNQDEAVFVPLTTAQGSAHAALPFPHNDNDAFNAQPGQIVHQTADQWNVGDREGGLLRAML